MQEAERHPTTSRRVFIGAATIGLLAGAPIAALAAVPGQDPDAELLGLIARFDALERRINLTYQEGHPAHIEDDHERDAFKAPMEAEQEELLDRICDLEARTLQGFKARAASLILWSAEAREAASGEAAEFWHDRLLGALLRDITREARA